MTLSEKLRILFELYDLTPGKIVRMAKRDNVPGITEGKIKSLIEQGKPVRNVDRYVFAVVCMYVRMPPDLIGEVTFDDIKLPLLSGSYQQLRNEGKNCARAGLYRKAVRYFHSAALKAENDNMKALAFHNISQCFFNLGIYYYAEQAAMKSMELLDDISNHWNTSYLYVRILVNQKGRQNLAKLLSIGLYDQADTDNRRADASAVLAQLEYNAGNYAKAVAHIKKAVSGYGQAENRRKESYSRIVQGYYEFLDNGDTTIVKKMEKAYSDLQKHDPGLIDTVSAKNLILRIKMQNKPQEAESMIQEVLKTCEEWKFWDDYFFAKVTLYDGAGEGTEKDEHLNDIANIRGKLSSWTPVIWSESVV